MYTIAIIIDFYNLLRESMNYQVLQALIEEAGFLSVTIAGVRHLFESVRDTVTVPERYRFLQMMGFTDSRAAECGIVIGCVLPLASAPSPPSIPSDVPGRDVRHDMGCVSDDPKGSIAPFAQKNYYREAAIRLKAVATVIRRSTGIEKRNIRVFVNSGLPEKEIAQAIGVGFIGKNSLLITPEVGSMCILCHMIINDERERILMEETSPVRIPQGCGTCVACIRHCPTGAIRAPGVVDPRFCIQGIASQLIPVSEDHMEVWGNRIYGCQACQDVCPFNAKEIPSTDTAIGVIGPTIPLSYLLSRSLENLTHDFKETVLGMRWIDKRALQRNALISAGNLKARTLLPLINRFYKDDTVVLRRTAAWSVTKITSV